MYDIETINITQDEILRINSKSLTNLAKLVLLYILPRQGMILSFAKISIALGSGRTSTINIIGDLEEKGHLKIDKSFRNGNIYFLTSKLKDEVDYESTTE